MSYPINASRDMTNLWWRMARLTIDTQLVVAMRVMGMTGLWSVPNGENRAMFQEKAPAFAEAAVAGTISLLSGRSPDRVMYAVIKPLSKKARANRTRLARRGPRKNP